MFHLRTPDLTALRHAPHSPAVWLNGRAQLTTVRLAQLTPTFAWPPSLPGSDLRQLEQYI